MSPSRQRSYVTSCTVSGDTYTLYTCPNNCRTSVPLIFISNADGAVTVDLIFYDASSTTSFPLLTNIPLDVTEVIQLSNDHGFTLEAGDRIEVICTGASVEVTALCTVVEQFNAI